VTKRRVKVDIRDGKYALETPVAVGMVRIIEFVFDGIAWNEQRKVKER